MLWTKGLIICWLTILRPNGVLGNALIEQTQQFAINPGRSDFETW